MDAIPVLLPGQTLQDARSMIEDFSSFSTAQALVKCHNSLD
ncbi:MAG: hypothetical protein PBV01_24065 [Brucella anthropi]